jgi:hypothetical protein
VFKLPRLNDPNAYQAVIWERARLAMTDPVGERDAAKPMSQDRAAHLLAEHAPEFWPSATPRPVQPQSADILAALGINPADYKGRVPCPAHGDGRKKTLSWATTPDGRLLLYCFAGCTYDAIRKAAGV